MEKKLFKELGLETVFDHAANLILQIFMLPGYGFCSIKIEDIVSLQVFSVILTSLSIGLSS